MNELKHKQSSFLSSLITFWGLVRWSLIRHKFFLPAFTLIQVILSFAMVYGFSLVTDVSDYQTSIYFSSGTITLLIIAVGCVLAPQIVSEAKHNGIFLYQRALPVARSLIIISDLIIWSLAAFPGIIMSCVAGVIRFKIHINVSVFNLAILLVILISMVLLGFAIAYLFPPNMVSLISQIIMIGTLLFSPVLYPADRLPKWAMLIYQVTPFVPISNIIRSTFFDLHTFNPLDLLVVVIWGIISFVVALKILSKKE